jgi:hypothetical protein
MENYTTIHNIDIHTQAPYSKPKADCIGLGGAEYYGGLVTEDAVG